jgi:hypothetical protein
MGSRSSSAQTLAFGDLQAEQFCPWWQGELALRVRVRRMATALLQDDTVGRSGGEEVSKHHAATSPACSTARDYCERVEQAGEVAVGVIDNRTAGSLRYMELTDRTEVVPRYM